MKDNYNIKVNPPELSSEKIKQHQDFDALLASFEQAPTAAQEPPQTNMEVVQPAPQKRKRLVYLTSALVTLLAASLVYSILTQPVEQVRQQQPPSLQIKEVLALNSPLPQLEQAVERKMVQAEQGEVLTYASGSKVTIPASAFVDKTGAPVKGAVEITYREFNDPVDMFLAGVPKQLNKHQDLQSTGMMEIKGFQNGEPVYLTMDKSLDIELQGRVAKDMETSDLGVYVYSQQEDAWTYQSKDQVELISDKNHSINSSDDNNNNPTSTVDETALAPIVAQLQQERQKTKPVAPIQPGVPAGVQVFDFDIDEETAPELAQYNQKIDLMTDLANVTPETFDDTTWTNMELKGNKEEGYVLILEYEAEDGNIFTRTMEVAPVVVATEEAKAAYKSEKARYEEALEVWEAEIIDLAQSQLEQPEQWVQIINKFTIQRFGLWNCGKPVEWTAKDVVATQFVNLEGEPVALREVFVATQRQQFYYSSPSTDNSSQVPLRYQQEQKVWAMSAEGELLVAEEQLASNPQEPNNSVLSLRPVAVPESAADLRTLLTL